MSNITTAQAVKIIASQYGESTAAEAAANAEQIGYDDVDEFFSIAMSKILYSDDQIANGDRFPVEPGSLDDLI